MRSKGRLPVWSEVVRAQFQFEMPIRLRLTHSLGKSLGFSIGDCDRRFWAASSGFGIRVCVLRFREKAQTLNPQVRAQGLYAHLRAEAPKNLYYIELSEN